VRGCAVCCAADRRRCWLAGAGHTARAPTPNRFTTRWWVGRRSSRGGSSTTRTSCCACCSTGSRWAPPSPASSRHVAFIQHSAMQQLRIGRIGWPLNDGQIPNFRGVRVAHGTSYNPGEGNRRASRNGRVSSSPTPSRFATFSIATSSAEPVGGVATPRRWSSATSRRRCARRRSSRWRPRRRTRGRRRRRR
jgi:hypothetical protein